MRRRIATHDFGIGQGGVTVSIGIAEHRVGDSRDTLLRRTDKSLYRAKHGGRNQVMTTS
ncbi:diguanylate cyclase domain-containing protein [Halomonas cerina]|uniref:diguanylate cyclase domain-containing protein n=1 Tax=Halomonas cerina TaxID=447424 RepID=UPI0016174BF2|nr:diguanylate cyclase [Halomonas cerina]